MAVDSIGDSQTAELAAKGLHSKLGQEKEDANLGGGQVGAIHSTINLVLKTSYIDLISTRNEAMLKLIKACKSPGFKPDGVQQPIKAQQKGLHSKLRQGN